MEATKILQADLLDILFEGRNKSYGAYDLRKTYNNRIGKAFTATAIICLLLAVINICAGANKKSGYTMMVSPEITLDNLPDEKKADPIKPPPVKPPAQQLAMAKVTIPNIVPDNQVKPEDTPPVNETLENIQIGTENRQGDLSDIVAPPAEESTSSNISIPDNEEKYLGEWTQVQIEAQFPGGINAWSKFLEQHLNASIPVDNAAPPGRYTVVVSFLVNNDGNISEVEALNNPGYGIAEEAVRVIKKSRQWVAAVQNGRHVIYRQKQSVTFEVSEQ